MGKFVFQASEGVGKVLEGLEIVFPQEIREYKKLLIIISKHDKHFYFLRIRSGDKEWRVRLVFSWSWSGVGGIHLGVKIELEGPTPDITTIPPT